MSLRFFLSAGALLAVILALVLSACATPASVTTPAPTATPSPSDTPEPTATTAPTATAEPTSVPGLTWTALQNAAYPDEFVNDGVAQLVDGTYSEEAAPGSATKITVTLSDVSAYGDLNGDGVEDAVVVLVTDPGGSGTFYTMVAVLNDRGMPNPVATASLGDRVILNALTVDAGQISVEMVIAGPDDPLCCPNTTRHAVYALQGGTLALLEQTDTPGATPVAP